MNMKGKFDCSIDESTLHQATMNSTALATEIETIPAAVAAASTVEVTMPMDFEMTLLE